MSEKRDDPQASAARRTLRLAELLLANPNGLSPQELVGELESSRSTLFVLLNTLKQLGYVEQSERRGRYRAGARLLAWRSSGPGQTADLNQAFYQEAEQRAFSETLALAVPAAGGPLVVAQVEGSQSVRAVLVTGQSDPGLLAAGQVLAHQPPESVRANGYALATLTDRFELALPVCRDGSQADAALLLNAPVYRWEDARLLGAFLPELRAMAARLSYRLGASYYAPYQDADERTLKPVTSLSAEEIAAFLSGPWTARLACIRPDGRPHVIPVWQEWDGSAFTVIAWQGSQWAGYLRQNANVSFTVDEPWPPLRRVTCRGMASPIVDQANLPLLTDRLARRYLGQPAVGLAQRVEGAFRIVPDTLRGFQGLSYNQPMNIQIDHLSHTFPGKPPRGALQDIQLEVPQGQFCAILGPSGCGKSTLLRLAAGLLQPVAGQVRLAGQFPEQVAAQRRIAWLAQSPALLPWLNARANVAMASHFARHDHNGRLAPEEALARVGLADAAGVYPHQLSGGMQQRLALARVLCQGAEVWLMDEPFAALDALTRERLASELLSLWQPLQPTVLWVTHNVHEALLLADRVVVLSPRPGHVVLDLALNMARPHREEDPAFQAALRQLRQALGLTSIQEAG